MRAVTDEEHKLATDVANTVLYYRQEQKCFETVEELKQAIADDVLSRTKSHAAEIATIAEDIVKAAGEWKDMDEYLNMEDLE